jgi:hypothetical protein
MYFFMEIKLVQMLIKLLCLMHNYVFYTKKRNVIISFEMFIFLNLTQSKPLISEVMYAILMTTLLNYWESLF